MFLLKLRYKLKESISTLIKPHHRRMIMSRLHTDANTTIYLLKYPMSLETVQIFRLRPLHRRRSSKPDDDDWWSGGGGSGGCVFSTSGIGVFATNKTQERKKHTLNTMSSHQKFHIDC